MDLGRLADGGLLVAAVTYGFLLTLSSALGVWGLPLYLGLILSLWRLSFEVLKRVAQGRQAMPPPAAEVLSPIGNYRLVLHLLFFGGLVVLLSDSRVWGDGSATTLLRYSGLALICAGFPASAALMALTTDIATALRPRNISALMRLLGRGYALILGCAAGLVLLSAGVQSVPLPGALGAFLSESADAWVLLAVFCLIGSAVRERRDVLDIPGEQPTEAELLQRQMQKDWQSQLDRAYASIRSGLTVQGYRTIRELLAHANMSLDAHEWVFGRMLLWEDKMHALAFARGFIDRLLEQEQPYRALILTSQCRGIEKSFKLDHDIVAKLAEYARSLGKHALADDVLEAAGDFRGPRLEEDAI